MYAYFHGFIMSIGICDFDCIPLLGKVAMPPSVPRSAGHMALFPLQSAAQPKAKRVRVVQERADVFEVATLAPVWRPDYATRVANYHFQI
jgi:hypothetical protein